MSTDVVAAIDLGSNSFHLIVARIANGHVQVLDRLREMVQLASGLDNRNRLSEESQQRALDCLARFGQRLRHLAPEQLRIVGTNTLRQARNRPRAPRVESGLKASGSRKLSSIRR